VQAEKVKVKYKEKTRMAVQALAEAVKP